MADLSSPLNASKHFPKDGLVIISMMKDLGITSYEPRVVNQLLEFTIRYVSSVLDDARAFATHSKKKAIDNDDVKLAVMMQLERVFTSPPPRDLLLEVARTKNNVPLPLVKSHCGIRLPPDRYCFSSSNYKLKNASSKKLENKGPGKFGLSGSGLGTNIKMSKSMVSSGSSAVSVKRPPNIPAIPRTQSPLTTTSKSVIKLSTGQMVMSTGGSMLGKARLTPQQVEVKIEPQDTLIGKRKREDGE